MVKIYFAADHAGFALKEKLCAALEGQKASVIDLGPANNQPIDYPDMAQKLSFALQNAAEDVYGVLICGSGIGISIAANRHPWIRAALCRSVEDAQMARQHNNANVLCLGERVTTAEDARHILDAFLKTPFKGGRHEGRVKKLEKSA